MEWLAGGWLVTSGVADRRAAGDEEARDVTSGVADRRAAGDDNILSKNPTWPVRAGRPV